MDKEAERILFIFTTQLHVVLFIQDPINDDIHLYA